MEESKLYLQGGKIMNGQTKPLLGIMDCSTIKDGMSKFHDWKSLLFKVQESTSIGPEFNPCCK